MKRMNTERGPKGPLEGVLMVRGKGTGFVTLPDREEDMVITREALGTALDGDIVEIEKTGRAEGRETGKVVRVIKRTTDTFVGTIGMEKGVVFLKSDNRRIHVRFKLPKVTVGAVGQKAVVKISQWKEGEEPEAEVQELIGKAGEHETEMQAIIRAGGFAIDFPPDVSEEAKHIYESQEALFIEAKNDPKRKDIRTVCTFTIDPADAKDFDDALSVRVLDNGLTEIGIHIADVSYYVKENDAIDMEAQERGTSIYLVDRVIPMLPEILSNDLCSLRPNEDRVAFSAIFTLDAEGHIKDRWFGQTLIHSEHRFSYEDAQEVLDKGDGPLHTELSIAMALGRKLRKQRFNDGAIAFETEEVKFELDAEKKPVRVFVKTRTETMLMIEDFMLLANREVAEHIYNVSKAKSKPLTFVYRIHDVPNPDKIEDLSLFLKVLGYEFKPHKGVVDGKIINKMLKEIDGKPQANLIRTATIRSMAKAMYSTKNIGHFGLAFKFYTHFTSPIRRYPDLMSHRLLRAHLDGTPLGNQAAAHYEKLCIQSSASEVRAVEAERDSIKFKQVEYLKDRIGEIFDGTISGVTEWGIYVEEKTSKAEGMVRLATMKEDYYQLDKKNYRVKGDRTKKTHSLGDTVKIKLVGANLEDRTLDFSLV